ncbi:MAG: hypothetical protein ABII27_02955 [bacterium]
MTSIIIGLIVVCISVYGLISWWSEFFIFCKGLLLISFFSAGIIAVIAGINGLIAKSKGKPK